MKSQDIVLDGHLVKQNSENALLHLSGILGTENDHLLVGEVDGNRRGRGHPGGESVSWEGTSIVDGVVGMEMLELFPRWSDEHVSHEQSMIGSRANNSNIDPITFIPAGKAINHINSVPSVQIVDCAFPVDLPHLGSCRVSESTLDTRVDACHSAKGGQVPISDDA